MSPGKCFLTTAPGLGAPSCVLCQLPLRRRAPARVLCLLCLTSQEPVRFPGEKPCPCCYSLSIGRTSAIHCVDKRRQAGVVESEQEAQGPRWQGSLPPAEDGPVGMGGGRGWGVWKEARCPRGAPFCCRLKARAFGGPKCVPTEACLSKRLLPESGSREGDTPERHIECFAGFSKFLLLFPGVVFVSVIVVAIDCLIQFYKFFFLNDCSEKKVHLSLSGSETPLGPILSCSAVYPKVLFSGLRNNRRLHVFTPPFRHQDKLAYFSETIFSTK